MAAYLSRLQEAFHKIARSGAFQTHPILHTVGAVLAVPLLYFTSVDYRAWKDIGPGGLPYNFVGWLLQLLLRPLDNGNHLDVSCYETPKAINAAGPEGSTAYLSPEDVPKREGSRPKIGYWILPQRQMNDRAKEYAVEEFSTYIHGLASEDQEHLKVSTSRLERFGPALFLADSVKKHSGAYYTRNEVAHCHPIDGSMHVSVAPRDAKLVIEQGWGQKFGLGGSILPTTYIMLYAPRTEEDIVVIKKIIRAATRFMLGERWDDVANTWVSTSSI